MEVRDGIYNFPLSSDSDIVYIRKEGFRTVRMPDGTIMNVPKYMYHDLTFEILPRMDSRNYIHPIRKFKFSLSGVKVVGPKVKKYILDSAETAQGVNRIKRILKEMLKLPVRAKSYLVVNYRGVILSVHVDRWKSEGQLYHVDENGIYSKMNIKELANLWNFDTKIKLERAKAEIYDMFNDFCSRMDIPYVSSRFMKLMYKSV